jgi:hypothetical protein
VSPASSPERLDDPVDRLAGGGSEHGGVELGAERGGDIEQREVVAVEAAVSPRQQRGQRPAEWCCVVASELGHEQRVATSLREHEVGVSLMTKSIQELRDLTPNQAVERHGLNRSRPRELRGKGAERVVQLRKRVANGDQHQQTRVG